MRHKVKAGQQTTDDKNKEALSPQSSVLSPPGFKVCDPAYSLCPDCAKALREGTCPKMKENLKKKASS